MIPHGDWLIVVQWSKFVVDSPQHFDHCDDAYRIDKTTFNLLNQLASN